MHKVDRGLEQKIRTYCESDKSLTQLLPFAEHPDLYQSQQAMDRLITIIDLSDDGCSLRQLIDGHLTGLVTLSPTQILRILTRRDMPHQYYTNEKLSGLIDRGGLPFRILRENAKEIDPNWLCARYLGGYLYRELDYEVGNFPKWRHASNLLRFRQQTLEQIRKSVANMPSGMVYRSKLGRWLSWSLETLPPTGETWYPIAPERAIAAVEAAGWRDDAHCFRGGGMFKVWKNLLCAYGPFRFDYTPENFKALVAGISKKTREKLKKCEERCWSLNLFLENDPELPLEILSKLKQAIVQEAPWTELSKPAQAYLKENLETYGMLLANLVSDNKPGLTPVQNLGLAEEPLFLNAYGKTLSKNCERLFDHCAWPGYRDEASSRAKYLFNFSPV